MMTKAVIAVTLATLSWSTSAHSIDCTVGGMGLCSCSELIHAGIIQSFDDCSQEAAVDACEDGSCYHDDADEYTKKDETAPIVDLVTELPYSFKNNIGPFIMNWGFPTSSTIDIEFSLPSDFYIGIGLTSDGVGDVIAGWVNQDTGNVTVGDYWDAGSRQPESDEEKGCKNDVEVVSGSYDSASGRTTIRIRRALDTGDSTCDEIIVKGPMDINYAWCDPAFSSMGGCFSYSKGCMGYAEGCLDSPHSADAANFVTVDFSGMTHINQTSSHKIPCPYASRQGGASMENPHERTSEGWTPPV